MADDAIVLFMARKRCAAANGIPLLLLPDDRSISVIERYFFWNTLWRNLHSLGWTLHVSDSGPNELCILAPHAPYVYKKKLNVDFFDDEVNVVDSLDNDARYCNQMEVRLVREEYSEYLLQFKILKTFLTNEGLSKCITTGVFPPHVVDSNESLLQFLKTCVKSKIIPAVPSLQGADMKPNPAASVLSLVLERTRMAQLARQQQQLQQEQLVQLVQHEREKQETKIIMTLLAEREEQKRKAREQEAALINLKMVEQQRRLEAMMILQLQEQQRVAEKLVSNESSRMHLSLARGCTEQVVSNDAQSLHSSLVAAEPEISVSQKLQLLEQRRQQHFLSAKRKRQKRGSISVCEVPSTRMFGEFDVLCENSSFVSRITPNKTTSTSNPSLFCSLAFNPGNTTYYEWMKDKLHEFNRAVSGSNQRDRIVNDLVEDIIANNGRFLTEVKGNVQSTESNSRKYVVDGKVWREMDRKEALFATKLSMAELLSSSFSMCAAAAVVDDAADRTTTKTLDRGGGKTQGGSGVQEFLLKELLAKERLDLGNNSLQNEISGMKVDILKQIRATAEARGLGDDAIKGAIDIHKQISAFPCEKRNENQTFNIVPDSVPCVDNARKRRRLPRSVAKVDGKNKSVIQARGDPKALGGATNATSRDETATTLSAAKPNETPSQATVSESRQTRAMRRLQYMTRCVPSSSCHPFEDKRVDISRDAKDVPPFDDLKNFHAYTGNPVVDVESPSNYEDGGDGRAKNHSTYCFCVMCGERRLYKKAAAKWNLQVQGEIYVPRQNRKVCSHCDTNVVWKVLNPPHSSGGTQDKDKREKTTTTGKEGDKQKPPAATVLEIKFCKGCKNFRRWSSFGNHGKATKCSNCKERQAMKYLEGKYTHDREDSENALLF